MTETAHIKALAKAQAAMGKLIKGVENPAFKRDGKAHKYADLTAVLEACATGLHENGFAILQPSGKDEGGLFTDTVLVHESGGEFRTRVYMVGMKPDMQGLGSAMTYARRYGLMALTGLAPEDDDGNEAVKKAPVVEKDDPPPQVPEVLTPVQSRDRMLTAIGKCQKPVQYTGLVDRDDFKASLTALFAVDEPKALEVQSAMAKAEKALGVIRDDIPEEFK